MTIKDITDCAGVMLENADADLLDGCARRAVDEVATEYLPVVEEESFTPQAERVAFTQFTHFPRKIYAVYRRGALIEYALLCDGIAVAGNGDVTVRYGYLPDGENVDARVPCRVYAYGAAAEYCLIVGLFDEAAAFDKRFRDALMRLTRKGVRVRERRWL